MYERSFKGIDLNLLVVFAVVMREGSTIAAAERLCLTQSAISQSLRRLRLAINDELFVRDRKGIAPTPRALALYDDICPLLSSLDYAINQKSSFDPAHSARRFRIRLKTIMTGCIATELARRVALEAPGVSLHFCSGFGGDIRAALDQDGFDIGISVVETELHPWHREYQFREVPMVAIYDGQRLGIEAPISLKNYMELPHLIPPHSLIGVCSVDAVLTKHELSRPHQIITNDFSAYPLYLKKLDAIGNCPLHLARNFAAMCDLTISKLPFTEQPFYRYGMFWHGKNDLDSGHAWLRSICIQLVADLDDAVETRSRAFA